MGDALAAGQRLGEFGIHVMRKEIAGMPGMNNEVGMMAKATQSLQEKIRERHAMSDREAAQQLALENERENNLRQQQDEATLQARVVTTIGQALEMIARGDLTPAGVLR